MDLKGKLGPLYPKTSRSIALGGTTLVSSWKGGRGDKIRVVWTTGHYSVHVG